MPITKNTKPRNDCTVCCGECCSSLCCFQDCSNVDKDSTVCPECKGTTKRLKWVYALPDFQKKFCCNFCKKLGDVHLHESFDCILPCIVCILSGYAVYIIFWPVFHILLVLTNFWRGKYWGYGYCRACYGTGKKHVVKKDIGGDVDIEGGPIEDVGDLQSIPSLPVANCEPVGMSR